MNYNMVPGLVLRRARLCHRLVPLFCALEVPVDIYDHSAIVEKPMADQFTSGELYICNIRHSSYGCNNVPGIFFLA